MKKSQRFKNILLTAIALLICDNIFHREPFISFFRGIANTVVDFLFALFS